MDVTRKAQLCNSRGSGKSGTTLSDTEAPSSQHMRFVSLESHLAAMCRTRRGRSASQALRGFNRTSRKDILSILQAEENVRRVRKTCLLFGPKATVPIVRKMCAHDFQHHHLREVLLCVAVARRKQRNMEHLLAGRGVSCGS
jgi:hypothetical protein